MRNKWLVFGLVLLFVFLLLLVGITGHVPVRAEDAFDLSVSLTSGHNVCNPAPDYCMGTAVVSTTRCIQAGNNCVEEVNNTVVSCTSSCIFPETAVLDQKCVSPVATNGHCTSITNFKRGTCCVNAKDSAIGDNVVGVQAQCGTSCGEGTRNTLGGVNVLWEDSSICAGANLSCGQWQNCDHPGDACFKVCWDSTMCIP